MHWKFWERKGKDEKAGRDFATASASMPKAFGAEGEGVGWFPLAGSAREILGLQQLIGNQAVVRLLAPEKLGSVLQGRKD